MQLFVCMFVSLSVVVVYSIPSVLKLFDIFRYKKTIEELKKFPSYACPKQDGNIALGEQCIQVVEELASYESAQSQCEQKLGRVAPPISDIQNEILR